MMVENQINYASDSLSKLNDYQEKVSSGKEFTQPSDDPSGAVGALSIRSTLTKHEAYIDTGNTMNGWLTATDSAMTALESMMTRAMNLVLQGSSDTMGVDERVALGNEIDIVLRQAVDNGNTRHQGEYIFAGFKTDTQPFTLNDGPPTTVTYNGNATTVEEIQRNIGPEQAMVINVDGKVFHDPANPGSSVFNALIRARDGLLNNSRAEIEASTQDLQAVLENFKNKHTEVGATQREVQAALSGMEKTKIDLKSLLSKKEDANMADAISNLQQQETVYKTVLEVGNRALTTMNLFDFIS